MNGATTVADARPGLRNALFSGNTKKRQHGGASRQTQSPSSSLVIGDIANTDWPVIQKGRKSGLVFGVLALCVLCCISSQSGYASQRHHTARLAVDPGVMLCCAEARLTVRL